MNTSPSYKLRLLLCAALTTGALACGGAEAEQGAQGPRGPVGEQGEPGEDGQPGTDGEDGTDGTDGTDGEAGLNSLVITESVEPGDVCANGGVTVSVGIDANGDEVLDEDEVDASETVCNQNDAVEDLCDEAFAITGVTGVEQALYEGQVSDPITVESNDDANLSLAFVGGGELAPALTSNSTFTVTPQELGEGQQITVVAAGQCGSDVITIALPEVEPFESLLSVVHVFSGAGLVDVAPSGTLDIITTLGFGEATGPLTLTPGEFTFDLLDQETVVATTDTYTLEPSTAYSLIAHNDGGSLAFTLIEDDLTEPSSEGTFRARIVHMAEIAGTVDVSAGPDTGSLAPLATGVAPGDVGTFAEYDETVGAIQIDAGGTILTYEDGVDTAFFEGDIANIYAFDNAAGNVRLLVHYLNFEGISVLRANPGGAPVSLFDFEDGTVPAEFIQGGNADWSGTDADASQGTFSLASGDITHNQTSTITLTYDFPSAGILAFDWKVSSESGYDFLYYCADPLFSCARGSNLGRISGSTSWATVQYPIDDAGSRSFEWTFEKDGSADDGLDMGWIDNITFVGEPSLL
ncbi:DUF4397 domain-containing protein [Lujinxingia vulgaris]|uniref:DUF4397 domain-containing protein n=1 Tax=Lujinxingia vulgaris TaxID=2600176 RepID=A0A5C6WZ48_9DELT|nr:DUF4397 domain-containing protein [Lujinxingia vulgaris]TXD34823.1 DUF4397 domain-containing protein [Lujinxingia vulgaris]